MTKKGRRQQRRKDVLKKTNTTAMLNNIHKPTTRHKWDSAKIQRALLSQIISEVGLFANTDKDQNLDECLSNIVASMTVIKIDKSSMYRWYVHYQKYGEIPVVTATREGRKSTSKKWNNDEISYLKRIVNRFPQYYLDEIADVFHARFPSLESRKSEKDIWLCLTEKCNYRLKVYTDIALQRNEQERNHFRHALDLMVTNPEQVILIDETARDKNSSRRRRMWALRGQKAEFNNIFDAATEEDYSMIGAADIHGFVVEACELVFKGDVHQVQGTIDGERFVEYVRHFLVPVLGNYAESEPRSIVIMDNASIHNNPEVRRLINKAGAMLLFTARYSPDINPIEYFFHQYKSQLKRERGTMTSLEKHQASIHCVNDVDARNTFVHCGYPGVVAEGKDGEIAIAALGHLGYF